MTVSPGARIGPYDVVGLLGAGGMGEVYRGRDTRLHRPVAIKVITPNMAEPDLVRRFESEALSASALNHPNILTVYEFGVHEGQHYLVTEFIEGETLRQRLRAGPLPLADAIEVATQVASALDAAHAAGLIHRDVKPENVMLRPDGYVKVLDFGLAKLAPTARAAAENMTVSLRTEPGVILGTVGYMAPEQVRGLDVDQRADVWSLGVVLHEMITGQSPFAGATMSDVIAMVLERQPPRLVTKGVDVPAELERIVHKALAKERDDRYGSIKDLQADLRRVRQRLDRDRGETPRADRGRERNVRRWWAAAVAAIAVIFVVLGLAWQHRASTPGTAVDAASALPLRRVDYWLTVQKMREGSPYQQPFESSGQEIFENGWKFRLNVRSGQPGFLYLLNQGPAPQGSSLHLLFPIPSVRESSAALPGGEPVQTSWYVFDEHQGTEQFWIVWSARQVPEIERAQRWVNSTDLGHVKDLQEAAAIQQWLARYATGVKVSKDSATKRSVMEGRGDVIVSRADLEHH